MTIEEFKHNYHSAIEDYKRSVWNLAALLHQTNKEHGRKTIELHSKFGLKKINWLIKLGTLSNKEINKLLLPEHYSELINLSTKERTKFINLILTEGWNTGEVAKRIRQHIKQKHKTPKKQFIPYHVNNIKRLLNDLPNQDKEQVLKEINNILSK